MMHPIRMSTTALAAAVLGLGVAACQPQGEAPMAEPEADSMVAEEATAAPPDVLSVAEMQELLVGNTIFGRFDAWSLDWSEYFASDGTAKAWLKFESGDEARLSGMHYPDMATGQYCTEYPELEDQKVFCNNIFALGDGRYQQLNSDGTKGAVYNRIVPGDQVDALE